MKLKIKHYIAQNGERFSLLYDVDRDTDDAADSASFPLFYPTAYVTRQLLGQMHNSQVDQLRAIKKLYDWAYQEKPEVDLHQVLLSRQFLRPHQIASLASFLRMKDKGGSTISRTKYNSRIAVVADYLAWYAAEAIYDANATEVSSAIERMKEAINARCIKKKGSASRQEQARLEKKLSSESTMALLDLFEQPLKGINLKAHEGPRYRDVLALRILYTTGMRIGELLSLRLQDFIIASGGDPAYLIVRRNHDDQEDDRTLQPVTKTVGRKLAINDNLAKAIANYLIQRSLIPHVGFGDNAFLLVNHIRGPRQGLAIGISTFRSSLDRLQKKFTALREIHPHLLRHDWNYRFSIKASSLDMSAAKEQETREYLMGWVEGSTSARVYNRRYVQEQAFEIGLKMANDTSKGDR